MLFLVVFQIITLIIGIQILYRFKLNLKTVLFMSVPTLLVYPVFSILGPISIVFPIVVFILCLFWQTKKWLMSISLPLITLLYMLVGNFVFEAILVIWELEFSFWLDQTLYFITYFLISAGLCFLTRHVYDKFHLNRFFHKKYMGTLVTFLAILIIFIYFNITIMQRAGIGYTLIGLILIAGNAMVLLTMILTTFKISGKIMQDKADARQLEQLELYTKELEEHDEFSRIKRHDYLNTIISILGFLDDEENIEKLRNYIEQEILPEERWTRNEMEQTRLLWYLREMPAIKGLVENKLSVAKSKGWDISIEINKIIPQLRVPNIEMVQSLGIILDNAIEESEHCATPKIAVAFFHEPGQCQIIVENKCRDTTEHPEILKRKGYTTKNKNRGLGLFILENNIAKHDELLLETTMINDYFTQKMIISERELTVND